MRRKLIAGNWKMNNTPEEARALLAELLPLIKGASCDVAVCPPAVCLETVYKAVSGAISLGAQNMHWEAKGAFTGELSAAMLLAVGAAYVILGHSERREYFGETDETVNRKTRAAIASGLIPIVCVGESKQQRLNGYTNAYVAYQTKIALTGLSAEQVRSIVIAYEPIWAIGTGLVATDEQANETIGVIRAALREAYGGAADDARILYGGSMNAANARGLLNQPEIDGGLIGGASLKAADFAKIITDASNIA
ncbi:MAG: triose-phosphate isomerase [Oscillospiraceae bacterium]|jgi:triosephosphate isomerase|nr:triose-phosphate isomerase [Oscillospiraceae bacterium]